MLDKAKDSVYNYFSKGDGNNDKINKEIVLADTEQNNALVDGRRRLNEGSDEKNNTLDNIIPIGNNYKVEYK